MEMLQQLRDIYSKYMQDVAKIYKDAKPMDGLFGWGDDPRKDPCHMRFYEDVENWTKDFLSAGVSQQEVYEAADFMLRTPAEHREEHSFWFLYATQGLTREMIPRLSSGQCAQLRTAYDEAYPKRDRMPVQKEVYALLKKGAGRR